MLGKLRLLRIMWAVMFVFATVMVAWNSVTAATTGDFGGKFWAQFGLALIIALSSAGGFRAVTRELNSHGKIEEVGTGSDRTGPK